MIVLIVQNLYTIAGNRSKDSLTIHTNHSHIMVQLPHALGKENIRVNGLMCYDYLKTNGLMCYDYLKTNGLLDPTYSFWDVRLG